MVSKLGLVIHFRKLYIGVYKSRIYYLKKAIVENCFKTITNPNLLTIDKFYLLDSHCK